MSEQIEVRSTDASVWTAKTTDKGDALLAKLAEGYTLDITRALSGSGTVDASLLKQQTTVSSPKQTVTIHPVAYPEAKKCKFPITITNVGLASSYNATQIGVYANDPDEGEILFFLAQSTDGGVSVKSEALQHGYAANFDFYVGIGDADSVNVTVDPSNSVTQEAMENYVNTTIVAYQEAITTGGTGAAYTARVPGITELKPGVSFIMRPHIQSTTTSPTLNVNGLGAKVIRQPLTTNTGATTTPASASWLLFAKPVRVMYDGAQWVIDRPRPSATTLYGEVAIANGGTGADTVAAAQKNLHVAPATESEEFPGCYYRTVDGEKEWLNPPMVAGTEYRTTERWAGKPVYARMFASKSISGSATNATFTLPVDSATIIEANGITSGGRVLPYMSPAQTTYLMVDSKTVTVELGASPSKTITVTVWVKYTK